MSWIKRNPILVIFLVLMAVNAFQSGRYGSIGAWVLSVVLTLPGIIVGITVHEFAHAFSAWKLGDDTAKLRGRVTLNPAAHIDPVGMIALIFVGFGWGKPVPVNPFAFRENRRLKNIIVDIAGSATNFVAAFLFTGVMFQAATSLGTGSPIYSMVASIVTMNLVLMVFNLLPVPPLDGFGILTEIFDLRRFSWYQVFYNNGSIILLVLILFKIVNGLLSPALQGLYRFFYDIWAPLF
jgi:Zn-dependent protease